jgi:hypothetical protein
MVYGMAVGPTNAAAEEDEEDDELDGASRTVKAGQRVRSIFIDPRDATADLISS